MCALARGPRRQVLQGTACSRALPHPHGRRAALLGLDEPLRHGEGRRPVGGRASLRAARAARAPPDAAQLPAARVLVLAARASHTASPPDSCAGGDLYCLQSTSWHFCVKTCGGSKWQGRESEWLDRVATKATACGFEAGPGRKSWLGG